MPKEKLDRAKQFMPFDALKVLKEALHEKEVEIEHKVELSDEKNLEINEILRNLKLGDKIEITYYSNNIYITIKLQIKKISLSNKKIFLNDRVIYFKDIRNIKIIDYL